MKFYLGRKESSFKNDGLSQGSVIDLLCFNVYNADILVTKD